MPGYLVLLAPSSNRVYAGAAPEITAAEVEVLISAGSPSGFGGAEPVTIAGIDYLLVTLADDVDPQVLGRLAATPARATCSGRWRWRRGAGSTTTC